MKPLLLLIIVLLLSGCFCEHENVPTPTVSTTGAHTVGIVDNIHTIELEGHEYFFVGEFNMGAGLCALTHKANCKFCVGAE